jgi:hypothetical protein
VTAIERDDEGAFPPGPVVRVDMRSAEEHPILDAYCMQFAGADSDEGKLFLRIWFPHDVYSPIAQLRAP